MASPTTVLSSHCTPLTGSCPCKSLTYSILASPLITHCCHCTYCQLETGSAFALNLVIECYNFSLTSSTNPLYAHRPSPSAPDGSNHIVASCPNRECNTDIFSYYGGNRATVYVKVGTLEMGCREKVRPDVHIFTESKVAWLDLGKEEERGAKVFEGFYDAGEVWGKEELERLKRLRDWKVEQDGKGVVL
ncbi:glutathione-dependent formaldehyde- gfa [Stagonosporopsis vannaccii]|nr:glutathione-dependent formaldehyde- gfa [Stagonosporopsis vannaccii]